MKAFGRHLPHTTHRGQRVPGSETSAAKSLEGGGSVGGFGTELPLVPLFGRGGMTLGASTTLEGGGREAFVNKFLGGGFAGCLGPLHFARGT